MDLFDPLPLRGLTLRNRLVVSPMCQYSAIEGYATDYHLVHLGRFALGGFALVMVEATAVTPQGRITPGDLGLWSDAQVAKLHEIAAFIKDHGAAAGIQLAHAGRKASSRRPWDSGGSISRPLDAEDVTKRKEAAWRTVAPSAIAYSDDWPAPSALSRRAIDQLRADFAAAVRRARKAGFDVLEIHAAHGYLLNSFLSPLANRRTDAYGGDRENRMRLLLEIAEDARAIWPTDRPVFVRVSAVDGAPGGLTLADTIALARQLKARGVDVLDCSSGGVVAHYSGPASYGYQVSYAEQVRRVTGLRTMAVGLILKPRQAQTIIAGVQADLVASGRQALFDPQWPLHAQAELALPSTEAASFTMWPQQSAWWLARRAKHLERLAQADASPN
ncbi:MAG TPA: NADH:flavin oxidoreductase/NADH oxidase [Nevskiaceae bacterium]|nr:NADH:flavin oxidoreductase/NADH oxidase [Nevskiaceae bacterium]